MPPGPPSGNEPQVHAVGSTLPDITFAPAFFPSVLLFHSPTDFPWECFLIKILTHKTFYPRV